MVQLGRQFDIHGVLKRVFYELVSSSQFWEVLVADRQQTRLSEADVLRLVETRLALGASMCRRFRRRSSHVVGSRGSAVL